MIDPGGLIEYAQRWIELHRENKYQREAAKIMQRVVDALVSVRAERDADARSRSQWEAKCREVIPERDAALARIAELEAEAFKQRRKFENMAEFSEHHAKQAREAEARIAEAAKLHRKYTYYDLEDSCQDTTDEHREEHHHEASDDIGEFYCDQMPTGDVCCDTCRDVNGDRVDWPCETAKILGLNEGAER